MTVKRLNDLYYIRKQIERIDDEMIRVAIYAGPAGYRTPDLSGMPRSPSLNNKSDEAFDRIGKLREEKGRLLLELEEIESWIHSLRHRDQLIIRYRYEDQLSWQEIAERIGGKETMISVQTSHYRCVKGSEK